MHYLLGVRNDGDGGCGGQSPVWLSVFRALCVPAAMNAFCEV